MFRGMKMFKCTQCGNSFKAADVEFMATTYSMPQRCPQCGSIRTRPAALLGWLRDEQYKKIWRWMEEQSM